MTQDDTVDTTDTQDQSSDDSAVMKALRSQIKDLKEQVKAAPDRSALEAEIREQLTRDSAIERELVSFGHPAGILDVVKAKLGEKEPTHETVAEALTSIGYKVEEADAASGQGTSPANDAADLAKVADLSARVQSAAGSGASASITDRIKNATSPEEIVALAAEGGFLRG